MSNLTDEKEGSSLLTFLSGVLVGATVGTVVGLLLAPKSGTETRHQLSENMFDKQNKAKHLIEEAKVNIGQTVDLASKNIESTVSRVVDAFNAGTKAAQDSAKEQNIAKNDKSDKINDVKSENSIKVESLVDVKEDQLAEDKEGKDKDADG